MACRTYVKALVRSAGVNPPQSIANALSSTCKAIFSAIFTNSAPKKNVYNPCLDAAINAGILPWSQLIKYTISPMLIAPRTPIRISRNLLSWASTFWVVRLVLKTFTYVNVAI